MVAGVSAAAVATVATQLPDVVKTHRQLGTDQTMVSGLLLTYFVFFSSPVPCLLHLVLVMNRECRQWACGAVRGCDIRSQARFARLPGRRCLPDLDAKLA